MAYSACKISKEKKVKIIKSVLRKDTIMIQYLKIKKMNYMKEREKMKQFLQEKRIVVVSVIFAVMFFALLQIVGVIDTNYSMVIEYEDIVDGRVGQLFYDTGKGFNVNECITSLVDDNQCQFVMKYKSRDLKALRIDPINRCETIVIDKVYFKWFGLAFDEVKGDELYTYISIYENCNLKVDDSSLVIECDSDDPSFIIDNEYIGTIHNFFVKVRVIMCIINIIISLIAALVIDILYYYMSKGRTVFKNLKDIILSVFFIFYIATCLLHKYHNVKFATLTGMFLGPVSAIIWFAINKLKRDTKVDKVIDKLNERVRYGLVPGMFAISVILMWKTLFAGMSYLYLLFYFIPIIISALLSRNVDIFEKRDAKKYTFGYVLFCAFFMWASGQMAGEYGSTITMLFKSSHSTQYLFNIMIAVTSWMAILEIYACFTKDKQSYALPHIDIANRSVVVFLVLLLIYEMVNYILGFNYTWSVIAYNVINYFAQPVNLLNMFLFIVMYLCVASLINRGVANIIFGVAYIFLLIGNIVKLIFHDTYFTIADVFQISDFFRIAKGYVTIKRVALVLLLVVVIAVVIYLERKRIKDALKVRIRLFSFLPLIILMFISFDDVKNNAFSDGLNINIGLNWLSEREDAQIRGIVVYNYFNVLKYKEIFPSAPDDYTEEMITQYRDLFDDIEIEKYDDKKDDEVKPNIIVVMMESQFELDRFNDVNIDMVLDPVTKENKVATLISPRYGGGTASVEFEALTGLSVSFFPGDLVPYTTFFNSNKRSLPSLAQEFDDNGYTTVAVHPNTGSFYNRDTVYDCMGFDEFISGDSFDFSKDNCTADGFMKNSVLADKIIEKAKESEDNDEPLFLFSVSIEGHREYLSKYTDMDVTVKNDMLSDSELSEVNQYAQTVIEDDKFIESIIDYVENTDTPTIAYFFGDHLPMLEAFSAYGFTDDPYNQYSTPIVAYSNYKDIDIGCEYISPNQLAPQIILDAGIEHSSYYDYIYSLRDDYPVITKAFVTDTSGLDIYELIQYDIMYGKKWFYEEKTVNTAK